MKPFVSLGFFLFFIFLAACQQTPKGGLKVVIPVDDGKNNYTLQERELQTVSDIYAMAGSAAMFKTDGRFDTVVEDSGRERVTGYDYGTTPSAHFLKTGDVLHPSDFLSLSMATAMYHFEKIKEFFDAFGATKDLTFPRQVLINIVVDRHKDGYDTQTINNASFVKELDLFWINPYREAYLPLTFNGGVLAHEYLHSIFMRKIHSAALATSSSFLTELEKEPAALNEWVTEDQARGNSEVDLCHINISGDDGVDKPVSSSEIRKANTFMYASINEGIADYYAYEYTKNPNWIVASLPTEKSRVINSPKKFNVSAALQKKRFVEAMKTTAHVKLDPHCVGAYFSHFLWMVSERAGVDYAKGATLEFMESYAHSLGVASDSKFMSMGDLVRMFFKKKAPALELCTRIQEAFPVELDEKGFPCKKESGVSK